MQTAQTEITGTKKLNGRARKKSAERAEQPILPPQQTEIDTGDKKSRGRKTADGIEQQPKLKTIKESTGECMTLYKKKKIAEDDFKAAIKRTAERGNIQAKNLTALIKASAKGTYKEVLEDIEQKQFLFEQIGEVSGGPGAAA